MRSRNRKAVLSVVGCCLAIFWSGYLAFGYPGIMGTLWQEMYDVGAAETGAVMSFMLFALAVSMFFCGKIHMKVGMRRCILLGLVCNTLAMIVLLNAASIYGVYIWGFLSTVGCSFVYGPGLTTAQQWMPHRRGMASGVVNFVFGSASAIMSPIWNEVLEAADYETMNLLLLACILITNAAAMLLTESPDHARLTEEERAAHQQLLAETAAKSGKKGGSTVDFSVGQALKTKAFWLIWFTWMFMGAAGISMVSLSKSYAISLGLSSIAMLTAFNVVNGAGRIVAGLLADLIGGERTAAIAFAATTAAYAVLPHTQNPVVITVAAGCVGLGFGTLFTVTSPIVSGIFGLKNFGLIFGLIFTAYGLVGGMLGPTLSGIVLDATGNQYMVVFNYLAVFALIGAVLMLLLRRVQNQEKSFKAAEMDENAAG